MRPSDERYLQFLERNSFRERKIYKKGKSILISRTGFVKKIILYNGVSRTEYPQ